MTSGTTGEANSPIVQRSKAFGGIDQPDPDAPFAPDATIPARPLSLSRAQRFPRHPEPNMRVPTILLALTALPAFAAAQSTDSEWLRQCDRDRGYGDRERACEVRVTGFRPRGGVISASPGTNGGVQVIGWDRDSVAVHARIQAQADRLSDARALAEGVQISRSGNTVTADGPESGRNESWSVSFVMYVPRRSDLTLDTHNGPVSVASVSGVLDLRTVNGPLTLSDVGGDVHARTSNGPLRVELTGTRWQGAGLDAETSNGPVTLIIPERYSANLETGTQNGPINTDFELTVSLGGYGRSSRRLNATLGQGGAPVKAVTTNGPLTLRRPE